MTIQQPERASLPDDLVLNALQHPIFIVQGDGTVGQANAEAEEFFGASKSTLSRTPIEGLLPFASPVLSVIQQVRKSGIPVKEYRMDLTSPRLGPDKIVDVYASPLTQDSEQVVVMFQERGTAEKIAQHLLQRSAARSVSGLASMLAHEIKNPLSGIRGAAQLLEEGASSEDRDLTRLIRDETDRIVNLVDRMEIFSDESPRPRSAVNIHVILDHVQTVAAHGFAKHIRFTKQYDPSLPPVMVNRDQIIQVFLNLIKNAAEALGPVDGGEILLSTAFKPGIRLSVSGVDEKISLPLEFSVQDNGPGVPPDIMPHLFDPFITTKINGSGLGLPLVSKLVGEHGGMVECESNPKRTIFRILMPAFRESSDERQHRQAGAS